MIEKMNDVRLLRADEIECRVGQVKKDGSGCSLLLYKDARVDMRVLGLVIVDTKGKPRYEWEKGGKRC